MPVRGGAVAEIHLETALSPGAARVSTPTLRRAELLALLPVRAECVVPLALLGILEHLIGLTDLLELRLGARLFVHVRVELARQLAIGGLDLVGGRAALHSE